MEVLCQKYLACGHSPLCDSLWACPKAGPHELFQKSSFLLNHTTASEMKLNCLHLAAVLCTQMEGCENTCCLKARNAPMADLHSWWIFSVPTRREEKHVSFANFPAITADLWRGWGKQWRWKHRGHKVLQSPVGCGSGSPSWCLFPAWQPLLSVVNSSRSAATSALLQFLLRSGTLHSGICYSKKVKMF